LRSLGYEIVLVNSNLVTIMTDPVMAGSSYVEPLNLPTMEEVIERVDTVTDSSALTLIRRFAPRRDIIELVIARAKPVAFSPDQKKPAPHLCHRVLDLA
jgi:hypothetical protein